MKFNTAATVISFLGISSLCSAVIDKRTGNKVTDLGPVIQALEAENPRHDPDHPHCPILEKYEFSFNEKQIISTSVSTALRNNYEISFKDILEQAAWVDKLEENILTVSRARDYYQKINAFYRICRHLRFYNDPLSKLVGFRNEVALALESSKICLHNYINENMITSILDDPVSAKLTLVRKQNELINKIADALLLRNDQDKIDAVKTIKPISNNAELLHSLLFVSSSRELHNSILYLLVNHGVIDLSIRDREATDFARDQPLSTSQRQSLERSITDLNSILHHVLYILDTASPSELKLVRNIMLWNPNESLDLQLLKASLINNEDQMKELLKSFDNRLVDDIKIYLGKGESFSRYQIQFLTNTVINEIYSEDKESLERTSNHLDSFQIRRILEKHSIIEINGEEETKSNDI